jgi:hypothetical protein
MRVAERCLECDGRALVYSTVKVERFVIRYRRCDRCGDTTKTIQIKNILSSKEILDSISHDAKISICHPRPQTRAKK